MGSKIGMLEGSLGDQLRELSLGANRFVDLFAGSGAVSRFVAANVWLPVISVDLLSFGGVLTGATTERTSSLSSIRLLQSWNERAQIWLDSQLPTLMLARRLSQPESSLEVEAGRALCQEPIDGAFIWSHYGGYYFSPLQALMLSAYFQTMPSRAPSRTVALAALIRTASKASASPGHTAQPFRPTDTLLPHLRSAWRVDVRRELEQQVTRLAESNALVKGRAVTGDSVAFARKNLQDGDLVFCDPPYSDAQYSRFYHVLEGVARGGWPEVHGAGRAPLIEERPLSDFSRRTKAVEATRILLAALAQKETTVLWTYPEGDRSNGLTVQGIRDAADGLFKISETRIPMRHSTLGGSASNGTRRLGRRDLHEVLFTLAPR